MDTTTASDPSIGSAAVTPLVVSTANPRYLALATGNAAERRVVYPTGSHIWHNVHDGMGPSAAGVGIANDRAPRPEAALGVEE